MTINQKYLCLSVCIFLLFPFALFGQGPPIQTGTPVMLGLEGRGVRTFGKYISKENVNTYLHPVAFPYNINNDLQVGGIVPFAYKNPKSEAIDAQYGLGDAAAFFKYEILQKDWQGKTLRGLVKIQETFPTGNSESVPPLGTGEYQTLISYVTGYITTKWAVYANVGYNITSRTASERFKYDLAFGLPLLPQQWPPKQLNLYVEMNGNLQIDNGRNTLFLSPGAQFIAGKRVLLETGLQYPLIDSTPKGQKTNLMVLLGTRILLF